MLNGKKNENTSFLARSFLFNQLPLNCTEQKQNAIEDHNIIIHNV